MVPNEAEAPFVVLEALNISSVIGATTYSRRHLAVFLTAKSPVRVPTPKPEGCWGEAEGCRMPPPGS